MRSNTDGGSLLSRLLMVSWTTGSRPSCRRRGGCHAQPIRRSSSVHNHQSHASCPDRKARGDPTERWPHRHRSVSQAVVRRRPLARPSRAPGSPSRGDDTRRTGPPLNRLGRQRGSGGSSRRRGVTVWPGSQIGTRSHHPTPAGGVGPGRRACWAGSSTLPPRCGSGHVASGLGYARSCKAKRTRPVAESDCASTT